MLKGLPSRKLLAEANRLHGLRHGKRNIDRLLDQTVEECAELQATIMQFARGRVGRGNIEKEMADVIICIDAVLDDISTGPRFRKAFSGKVGKYLKAMRSRPNVKVDGRQGMAK